MTCPHEEAFTCYRCCSLCKAMKGQLPHILKKAHESAAKTFKELADGIIAVRECGGYSSAYAVQVRVLQHASAILDSCAWAGREP